MKKILLLLTVMLAAWTIGVNAETSTTLIDVSDSPVAISWGKTTAGTVTASSLTSAGVGDYIQVTVTGSGAIQCQLRDMNNDILINTATYSNTSSTENVYRFGLTSLALTEVQSNGFYVSGTNFSLKKIELISTTSTDNYNDVVWFGEKICSWNGIQLRSANYSSVVKGWTLRVHHKDLGVSARLGLYNAYSSAISGHDYVAVSGEYTDVTVDDAILEVMATDKFFVRCNDLTLTKIEVFSPTKILDVETILYQGTTPLTNWSRNYEQPLSVINSLQEGDVLKVTVSQQSEVVSDYPQLRVAWGTGESQRVNWACYNYECPHTYELTLTADQVTAIQTAKKLYLNGCNITVSRWTLTQQKAVSHDRGNAATTIWSGTQVIDWSASPSTFQTIGASAFANAEAGMKMRMNFSGMKLGAQGRIVKNSWSAFDDADTFEKLPTAWGDYFEYTLTSDMVTELQANGMHVTGVGYTLTSVELIDPMKEYVINATFDTDDIKAWELADGTPNLTVTLTNYEEQEVSTTVSASLMTDMFVDYNNYSVNITLDAGETKTIDLPITGLEPGFYRMAAKANNNMLCTYYIGYDPTSIVSPDDSQPDFWTFWDTWKARLAEIPIDAELTLLDGEESDARNVYEVKYKSVPETVGGEPVYIYGYYAEPKAEGTYPCIIHFHGTDKSGVLTKPSATTTGWCEFRFSARGQTLDKAKNGSEKYRTDPEKESSVDFYAYRLGDNDEHYYRYVYLDTRRAVDFVFSQAKVNKSQVFAAGGSQGGCLTYVCAALSDGKVRAIAPSITGHADFVHTMEIVGWPTNVFNDWINAEVEAGHYADYAAGKAALLAHQSYFDTKNFASRIYCPVITNFSLQDNTDGPHLNIAPYNLLVNVAAADKEYSINQFKGHATADNWGTTYMNFFQKYIDAATPLTIETPLTMSAACYGTYYNSTAVQLPAGMMAATIDEANNSAQTLTINWRYDGDEENNIIPGGTAVMLKSDAGNYTLTLLPANTDEAPTGNLLHGSDIRTTTTGGDKYYKLTYGSTGSANADVLGWYWGAANGGAFSIGAHKAWLALTNEQANNARFFSLSDNGETTAISNLNVNDNLNTQHPSPNTQMHNLAGQKVSDAYKGIVIVNGKKVIKK